MLAYTTVQKVPQGIISYEFFFFFSHTSTFQVTDVVPSPRFLPSVFIAHTVGHSDPTARRFFIEHLTLSRFPQVDLCKRKKSLRIYTRMHSGELELTKLTYTRLED